MVQFKVFPQSHIINYAQSNDCAENNEQKSQQQIDKRIKKNPQLMDQQK